MNILYTLIYIHTEKKICVSYYRTYQLRGKDLHSIRFIQYQQQSSQQQSSQQQSSQQQQSEQKQSEQKQSGQQKSQQQYINVLMKGHYEQLTEGSLLLSVNGISAITTPLKELNQFITDFPSDMIGEFNFFKFLFNLLVS